MPAGAVAEIESVGSIKYGDTYSNQGYVGRAKQFRTVTMLPEGARRSPSR
jgi:hypothetical protein